MLLNDYDFFIYFLVLLVQGLFLGRQLLLARLPLAFLLLTLLLLAEHAFVAVIKERVHLPVLRLVVAPDEFVEHPFFYLFLFVGAVGLQLLFDLKHALDNFATIVALSPQLFNEAGQQYKGHEQEVERT
jgi:cell division protein FtsX